MLRSLAAKPGRHRLVAEFVDGGNAVEISVEERRHLPDWCLRFPRRRLALTTPDSETARALAALVGLTQLEKAA
jgi:hypothetical protein